MDVLTTMGSGALNFVIIIIAIFVLLLITAGFTWFLFNRKLKNQYDCIIITDKGDYEKDQAGIYKDWKTKNRLFHLKKNKVGLAPDNIPYKWVGKRKTVFLFKTGLKRFHFIDIQPEGEDLSYSLTQEDLNLANEEHEKSKKTFSTTLLMQLIPIISIAVVALVALFIVIFVYRKFDVLVEVSQNLKETASILAQTKTGVIN